MSKRVRPRPNQITIDLGAETHGRLNDLLEWLRRPNNFGPFYSSTQLVRTLIDSFHEECLNNKIKNNSTN